MSVHYLEQRAQKWSPRQRGIEHKQDNIVHRWSKEQENNRKEQRENSKEHWAQRVKRAREKAAPIFFIVWAQRVVWAARRVNSEALARWEAVGRVGASLNEVDLKMGRSPSTREGKTKRGLGKGTRRVKRGYTLAKSKSILLDFRARAGS
jgi:hypothetical protein